MTARPRRPGWAQRGSRPRAPRDQRYDWAYLFGAVCPARDACIALVLPVANGETMNLHLAEVSRNVTLGVTFSDRKDLKIIAGKYAA